MATLQPPRSNARNTQSRLLSDITVALRQRHTQITFALVELFFIIIEFFIFHSHSTNSPLLPFLLLVILDLVPAFLVAWATARPLAIFAFLREVRQEMRQFYKIYTPLSSLKNHYETPIDFHAQDETRQERSVTISSLIRNLKKSLLILGLPGAGKTISLRAFEYEALKESLSLMLGRKRIPIYISMREYNAFLYKHGAPAAPQGIATMPEQSVQAGLAGSPYTAPSPLIPDMQHLTFIQYLLNTNDIRGLDHLRHYLERLIEQGRLLLLCDGLNEIDQNYLPNVCDELILLIQRSQNLVVMTCRELDYRDRAVLQRFVREKHTAEALILPLDRDQIRNFIGQYLQYSDDRGKRWRYPAEKFVSTIEMNGMIYNCTNPMMLVTMMQIINEVGDQQGLDIDTRGRLLRRFVSQLVRTELQQPQWSRVQDRDEDIILFLSYVACTARRAGFRNAIQLDHRRAQQGMAINRPLPIEESAALMLDWLNLRVSEDSGTLHQLNYSQSTIVQMLDFAQRSALIEISLQSNLSFRHELIAEYFVAEYLRRIDTPPHSGVPLGDKLLVDIGRWSEPVSIWAGMIEDPTDLARRLASLGQHHPTYAYPALALSLICMGVIWKSRSPGAQQKIILPHDVLILLTTFVSDDDKRDNLARIINRTAKEGSIEVYRSLLPLLLEGQNQDFDALLLQLDRQAMPQLLLDNLRDAIEASWSEDNVNRLIRILGLFGADIVRLAGDLLLEEAGTRIELRVALIKVLGRTNAQQAVKPLIARLSEKEAAITTAAVNALGYLGPNFVLDAVAEELRNRVPAHLIDQIHWATLAIIEYFLQERHEHVLTQNQYQRINDLLLLALAKEYHPDVREKAFSLLLQQATPPTQEQRRLSVITSLSHRLGLEDETVANAIIQLLKRFGMEATASLLEELKNNRIELARVRAIEILGAVLDPKGLESLLLYLSDASPRVQEQLAVAFCNYAPASIPHLIRVVRTDEEVKATRANAILIRIGTGAAVKQIIQALLPLVSKRTELLLDALARIQDEQAIKPLIGMLKSLRNGEEKAAPDVINKVTLSLIRTLGTFHHQQVVVPLRDVLLNDRPAFTSASQVALNGLGELAVTALVDALDIPGVSDGETVQARRVGATLLAMQPFPDMSLLKQFASCSEVQAQQLMKIFIGKGDTAPFLVPHLIDLSKPIRERTSDMLSRMTWEQIQGPLLDNLKSPGMIDAVKPFLLNYKQSIPLLVQLLGENERGAAAATVLLDFGTQVISYLVPGLQAREVDATRRSQQILVRLVKQEKDPQQQENVAGLIVGLFARLTPPDDWSGVLPSAWDHVFHILINDLAQVSIPALLNGLEVAELQKGSIKAFVRLIRRPNNLYSERARQELLKALLDRNRGPSAEEVFSELDVPINELFHDNDPVLEDYYWEVFQKDLHQTLFKQGTVESSMFPKVPLLYIDILFKRYMQVHPDSDLEYQENTHLLFLRTVDSVQKIDHLLIPLLDGKLDLLTGNLLDLEYRVEQLLRLFSELAGLKVMQKQVYKNFVVFLIETGITFENIRIPKQLPFIISLDRETSDETIEQLRRLLTADVSAKMQVAVLILFCDNQKLTLAKQRITSRLYNAHALDVIVINHESLLEIVAAREPEKALRRCVLSQMDLSVVALYREVGPTHPDVFFGREQELRKISDHISSVSYVLIGGRRIGKTSILNRLHTVSLPNHGFRTLSFDCEAVSTTNAFLTTSINERMWNPEPPAIPPATIGELLQHPPNDKPLVLLLDEADKFVPTDHKDGWQFFNTLRSLVNSSRLQVVLCGESALLDKMHDPNSPLFNFAKLMLLGPLKFSAIEELVTRPMAQLGIEITDQSLVVNLIYDFTSGHPNVVQRLCLRLIERMQIQGSRIITLDDVQTITRDPSFQEKDFLETYWGGATSLEKIITLVLSHEANAFRVREVQEILLRQIHIEPSLADTKGALDRLIHLRSILNKTQDGYEFAVKAFPFVLTNTTTMEDLLGVFVEEYTKEEHKNE